MGNPVFRFSLSRGLNLTDLQFDNNEFEVSIDGWDQIADANAQLFTWDSLGAVADGSSSGLPNTAAIGRQGPIDGVWPAGRYYVNITAENLSSTSGATPPFRQLLNVWGSNTGASLDAAISYTDVYDSVGSWDVGDGPITRTIEFKLTQSYSHILFSFSKVGPTSSYEVLFYLKKVEMVYVENVYGTRHIISEPDGWKDAKLKLERHPTFHSLVEYFEGSFIFYGENNFDNGGADYIRQIENQYGFDAEIRITVEADIDGDGVYEEEIFVGQLDLTGLQEVKDNKMEVPIIRRNLWSRFIAGLETPVDIRSRTSLSGRPVKPMEHVDIDLPPQIIDVEYRAAQLEPGHTPVEDESEYPFIQFDLYNVEKDEIEDHFSMPFAYNVAKPANLFTAKYGGVYDFDIKFYLTVMFSDPDTEENGLNTLAGYDIDIYLQLNDDNNNKYAFTQTDVLNTVSATADDNYSYFEWAGSLTLKEGDKVFVYAEVNNSPFTWPNAQLAMLGNQSNILNWTGMQFGPGPNLNASILPLIDTHFYVTAHTVFRQTEAQAFLIHDVLAAVVDRIT